MSISIGERGGARGPPCDANDDEHRETEETGHCWEKGGKRERGCEKGGPGDGWSRGSARADGAAAEREREKKKKERD